ncbi:hypothetical protein LguiA_025843 [Lonicera macranthoides]
MEELIYLHYLNLSFNELEGEVPKKGAFENASAISVLGNSKLCGGIEELKLPSCRTNVKKSRVPLALMVVIMASGAVLFFIIVIISIFLRSRRRRKARKDLASKDSTIERLLRISYHELYRATAGFSPQNLIGSGSFGSVYEGKLNGKEEKLVAVKRLNIASDVASAIHYLHDLCEPPVIHCDLKPSNILLDNDLTAHVGDFGLARLLSKSEEQRLQLQLQTTTRNYSTD